ncbi:MAG: tetratricopeptide repeat protein, partial [Acidobacteriota bacterium]
TDQRRLNQATRHLERAGWFYGLLGDLEKGAATFLKLGIVYDWAHEFSDAIAAAERALKLLGPEATGWLAAYAHHNLARYLHGRGDVDRAEAELDEHRELLEAAGETVRAHVTWLRGRIAWSRGELGTADRRFREALRWARTREDPFDAGLLCLERALVHLAQGRSDRVQRLAAQAVGFFRRAEEVDRETRGALELLEAAARQEALTRKALEHAVDQLEGAGHRRRCGDPDRSGG